MPGRNTVAQGLWLHQLDADVDRCQLLFHGISVAEVLPKREQHVEVAFDSSVGLELGRWKDRAGKCAVQNTMACTLEG